MMVALVLLVAHADPALSFGDGACGRLTGGVALPCAGPNFEAATSLTCKLGRHHLHPRVRDTLVDAWAALAVTHPRRRWQYGEMGWLKGGKFRPHHTHQAGRSADFFFPAVDAAGAPTTLDANPANLFGYNLHFHTDGRLGEDAFDGAALADHLLALEAAGRARGVRIRLIIMDAPFRERALAARPALRALQERFSRKPVWIAHDQHYHVEFDLPAQLRRPLRCR
ncbi:MAG: penicillin-insensitive murein endopeptidase [Deltaproteobacteria bacterium]|nr:penicillin-insensitive murein endopeptidase [Deltaproteobacteria bacterium]